MDIRNTHLLHLQPSNRTHLSHKLCYPWPRKPEAKGPPHARKIRPLPLTFGPTPIEKLDRLSQHLDAGIEVYAKREDCNSGLALGGNKLRKLEYIVPDAIASGADTLVSIGVCNPTTPGWWPPLPPRSA
jgi:hypothetical protein